MVTPTTGSARAGLSLGRVRGIAVRVDWSVLVIAWLLIWSLGSDALPAAAAGYGAPAYWTVAAVTATVFLGSLLAHELSHSLVAGRHGVHVRDITLWMLGGVATLSDEPADPSAALRIALAGPAMSVSLGALFIASAIGLSAVGAPSLIIAALVWLGSINVVLAVFNLVPAAPLDGGRVLAAVLWRRRGDRTSAAISATHAGRVFGYTLVGLGLLQFANGAIVGGVWFAFLGWFVVGTAHAEELSLTVRRGIVGVVAGQVMTEDPITVPADMPIRQLIDEHMLAHHCSSFPVVDDHGAVVGLVTIAKLKQRGTAASQQRARDVAWQLDQVATSDPDEELTSLLGRMASSASGRALVFDHGRLAGIISPSDIARVLQFAEVRG